MVSGGYMTVRDYLNNIAKTVDNRKIEENIQKLEEEIAVLESKISPNLVISGEKKMAISALGMLLGSVVIGLVAGASGALVPIVIRTIFVAAIVSGLGTFAAIEGYIKNFNDENFAKISNVFRKEQEKDKLEKEIQKNKKLKNELLRVKQYLPQLTNNQEIFSRELPLDIEQINLLTDKGVSLLCSLYLGLEDKLEGKIELDMPAYRLQRIKEISNNLDLQLQEMEQKQQSSYQRKRRSERNKENYLEETKEENKEDDMTVTRKR